MDRRWLGARRIADRVPATASRRGACTSPSLWLVLTALLLGCGPRLSLPQLAELPAREPRSTSDLAPLDCEGWLQRSRQAAITEAHRWLDAERDDLARSCSPSASMGEAGLSGVPELEDDGSYGYEWFDDPLTAGGAGVGGGGPQPGSIAHPGAVAETVSRRNVQVPGVDEADTVATDGKHVFLLGTDSLQIVQAWPPTAARLVATQRLAGTPLRLFVSDGQAVVFSALRSGRTDQTKITVIDLHDPSRPRELRALVATGRYLAARRIGTAVHVVLSHQRVNLTERLGGLLLPPRICRPDLDDLFADLRDGVERQIRSWPDSVWLPTVEVQNPAGKRRQPQTTCNLYQRDGYEPSRFTVLMSFDLRGGEPAAAAILDRTEVVYASRQALYLAGEDDRDQLHELATAHPSTEDSYHNTVINRFALHGSTALYDGSALVAGRLLNQFAMDEHGDRLRVATQNATRKTESAMVTVLSPSATDSLVIQGWLGEIAMGEDVRSARFVGDRGYLVTFREIDPFLALDLSGAQPKLLGELKIPGFASYIHPLAGNRVLTVGFGASDPTRLRTNDAVRLQLLDVRKPSAPRLDHFLIIGKHGSSSVAQYDHLAINYFAERELLLLPIKLAAPPTEPAGDSELPTPSDGATQGSRGVMAYQVGATEGFRLVGRIPSPAGNMPERTIVMDDYVVTIFDTALRVSPLAALSQTVTEVALPD